MHSRPQGDTCGHTRICKRGCGGVFLTVESVVTLTGPRANQRRQTIIPLHFIGGVPCPVCQGRTGIKRTRPDHFFNSWAYDRACKNPECGQIFTTLETVAHVVGAAANPGPARNVIAAAAQLPPDQLAELKAAVDNLFPARIPA